VVYPLAMPKLWDDTIEAHRQNVRDATLDAAAALVAEHGLASVTMSRIAQATGIGRATLYKYFPDIDAILHAWHERQISDHLTRLTEIGGLTGEPWDRLKLVLETYALNLMEHDGSDLAASLHRGMHVAHARHQLKVFICNLLAEGTRHGAVRDDINSDELAYYCLHALAAAGALSSKAAVRRLVDVTLAGLRPQS
jgi:AcrR family transcriptional regulator